MTNNYNIGNFQGVAGNVHGSTVNVSGFDVVNTQLKQSGLATAERHELETMYEEYTQANAADKKSIAERASKWLERNSATIGNLGRVVIGLFGGPTAGT